MRNVNKHVDIRMRFDAVLRLALGVGPVSEAGPVSFVDVNRLVAVQAAPCIVVDIAHHLCLNL